MNTLKRLALFTVFTLVLVACVPIPPLTATPTPLARALETQTPAVVALAPTVVATETTPPTVAPTATTPPTVAPTATTPPTVAPTATTPPTVVPTATTPPTVAPTATTPPTVAPTATTAPTATRAATLAPTKVPTKAAAAAAAATRTPTRVLTRTATPRPTATRPPATRTPIPSPTVDRHRVIITEADIAESIAGGKAAEEGVTAQNLKVDFANGKMQITADRLAYGIVQLQNLNMTGRLTAQDGVLMLVVESMSPRGLAANLVPKVANQALAQFGAKWYVEEVKMLDGRVELRVR